MDWKTRTPKYRGNKLMSVAEYSDLCSKCADTRDFEEKYISDFEAKVLEAIPEWDIDYLRQYIRFKECPSSRLYPVSHPKLAWRLKMINFKQYCRDFYGAYATDIAAGRWLSKQDIVTVEQMKWLQKRTSDFPTPYTSICIKFGKHWYQFQESVFTKKEMLSKLSILQKAVQILLTDKVNKTIEKRRYYQWDY